MSVPPMPRPVRSTVPAARAWSKLLGLVPAPPSLRVTPVPDLLLNLPDQGCGGGPAPAPPEGSCLRPVKGSPWAVNLTHHSREGKGGLEGTPQDWQEAQNTGCPTAGSTRVGPEPDPQAQDRRAAAPAPRQGRGRGPAAGRTGAGGLRQGRPATWPARPAPLRPPPALNRKSRGRTPDARRPPPTRPLGSPRRVRPLRARAAVLTPAKDAATSEKRSGPGTAGERKRRPSRAREMKQRTVPRRGPRMGEAAPAHRPPRRHSPRATRRSPRPPRQ
ncbi:uncharacterized protein DKFZp434B061-like [Meles meles]|uniref:uncharacterized protein DKFZp434B061-like n=1 Tax=Meles meles TaxID=9662 RepID=UPI001E69ACEB|nr:uncharacterized protein DKFZp434B061-like [Meles meles]